MFKEKIPLIILLFFIVSVGDPLPKLYNERMSLVAQYTDSLEPLEFLRDEIMVDVSVENSSGVVQNRKTSFFRNPNNSPLPLEMQPGILAWDFLDEEFVSNFDDVYAFDNANSSINVMVEGSKVWTSLYYAIVPSLYDYNVSLVFNTRKAFRLKGLAVETGFGLEGQGLIDVIFRVPDNWTVLSFTSGGTLEKRAGFAEVRWGFTSINGTLSLEFVPFLTNITDVRVWENPETVIDYGSRLVLSSIFPKKGRMTLTVDTLYEVSAALVESWSPVAPYAYSEVLPLHIENVEVLSVRDGLGECKYDHTLPLPTLYVNMSNETPGTYRVDYKNNKLIIYPRSDRKDGDNFLFYVSFSISFSLSNDFGEQPFPPYLGSLIWEYGLPFSDLLTSNITKEVRMSFALPSNVEPCLDRCKPANATVEEEDSKTVLVWIYDSPGSYFYDIYEVSYEIKPLREGFNYGCLVLVVEAVLLFISTLFVYGGGSTKQIPREEQSKRISNFLAPLPAAAFFLVYMSFIMGLGSEVVFHSSILLLWVAQLFCLVLASASPILLRLHARRDHSVGARAKL